MVKTSEILNTLQVTNAVHDELAKRNLDPGDSLNMTIDYGTWKHWTTALRVANQVMLDVVHERITETNNQGG